MSASENMNSVNRYYRRQSRIYDGTRWLFLFGRRAVVCRSCSFIDRETPVILDVGCGTGYLLERCRAKRPKAFMYGIDPSKAMLEKASRKFQHTNRTTLLRGTLTAVQERLPLADLILFSYSLTMMTDQKTVWHNLEMACRKLRSGGLLGIVDFNTTPFNWFKKWMRWNHVHYNYDLAPGQLRNLKTIYAADSKAYWGLWSYIVYIGEKQNPAYQ